MGLPGAGSLTLLERNALIAAARHKDDPKGASEMMRVPVSTFEKQLESARRKVEAAAAADRERKDAMVECAAEGCTEEFVSRNGERFCPACRLTVSAPAPTAERRPVTRILPPIGHKIIRVPGLELLTCEREGCSNRFPPNRTKKFCSEECKDAARVARTSAARKAVPRGTRGRQNAGNPNPVRPASFKDKICRCGKRFSPTGPRNIYCMACRENPPSDRAVPPVPKSKTKEVAVPPYESGFAEPEVRSLPPEERASATAERMNGSAGPGPVDAGKEFAPLRVDDPVERDAVNEQRYIELLMKLAEANPTAQILDRIERVIGLT